MILLCGIPSETPVEMVRQQLEKMGAPFVTFNQRDFGTSHLSFEAYQGNVRGRLTIRNKDYELVAFEGVYNRLIDHSDLPEYTKLDTRSPARLQCQQLHEALSRWIEIAPIRVVNKVRPMGSNSSKPYQAQLLLKNEFLVPETLITSDPDIARDFCEQHEKVIYKSISSVRSIVQIVSQEDLDRLNMIRWCPTQFQEFIAGENLRVHVIKNRVFATSIKTDAIDYRYSGRQGHKTQLFSENIDDGLADRCIKLAEQLNLPFVGIDLKITPSGEVYCFEVNPSPGFSYYESGTGQPISEAVAEYLMGFD